MVDKRKGIEKRLSERGMSLVIDDAALNHLAERGYDSVEQMKGSLSQQACPDPDAFERANYMKALKSYTSEFA